MSDAIHGDDKSDHAESLSLQKALYITCFATAIGSACFLVATWYIHDDEQQARLYIQERKKRKQPDSVVGDGEKEPLLNSDLDSQSSFNSEPSSVNINFSVNNDQIE